MGKSIELTPIDVRLFDIIKKYIEKNSYSPTVRELAGLLNVKSTSTVQDHLDVLEKKGYIKRNKSMPRTIKVVGYKSTTDLKERQAIQRIIDDNNL